MRTVRSKPQLATVCSSNATKLQAALAALGHDRATGEVLDVSDESAIKAFFEKIGAFDHLVFSVRLSSEYFYGKFVNNLY